MGDWIYCIDFVYLCSNFSIKKHYKQSKLSELLKFIIPVQDPNKVTFDFSK